MLKDIKKAHKVITHNRLSFHSFHYQKEILDSTRVDCGIHMHGSVDCATDKYGYTAAIYLILMGSSFA